MKTKTIPESERPKYWFIKHFMDGGRAKLRLLPNQWVPSHDPDTGEYEEADVTYTISTEKDKRTEFPMNTVFAVRKLVTRSGFYRVPDNMLYALTEFDPETVQEMIDAYSAYLAQNGGTAAPPVGSKKKETLLTKLMAKPEKAPPTIEDDGFYVDSDTWYLLMRNVIAKENTIMVGPAGTGKTEVIELIANKLGLDISTHDMSAMQDAVGGLLGVHRINKDGVSEFDRAKFSLDVEKDGIILLDELSRAPVSANNLLFPCLDRRRKLYLAMAASDEDREIEVNVDTVFFATANIGAEYTGTNELDQALKTRFMPVELDYLPEEIESKILQVRSDVDKYSADVITKLAWAVRNQARQGKLSASVSTRETLKVASLVSDGFTVAKALEAVFIPFFEGTKVTGERATVYTILGSR